MKMFKNLVGGIVIVAALVISCNSDAQTEYSLGERSVKIFSSHSENKALTNISDSFLVSCLFDAPVGIDLMEELNENSQIYVEFGRYSYCADLGDAIPDKTDPENKCKFKIGKKSGNVKFLYTTDKVELTVKWTSSKLSIVAKTSNNKVYEDNIVYLYGENGEINDVMINVIEIFNYDTQTLFIFDKDVPYSGKAEIFGDYKCQKWRIKGSL